jgi:hypothetical protein
MTWGGKHPRGPGVRYLLIGVGVTRFARLVPGGSAAARPHRRGAGVQVAVARMSEWPVLPSGTYRCQTGLSPASLNQRR